MKACTKCGTSKSPEEFSRDKSKKDGRCCSCKECGASYFKQRPARTSLQKTQRYKWHRRHTLRKKYGILLEDYERMLQQQSGVCAICKQPEQQHSWNTERVSSLAVDHNHKTGRNRGLLCHRCNRVLGAVNDDIDILVALKEYVEKYA